MTMNSTLSHWRRTGEYGCRELALAKSESHLVLERARKCHQSPRLTLTVDDLAVFALRGIAERFLSQG